MQQGEKKIAYKGIPIRITADISIETLPARRKWQDILNMMKEKKPTTYITVPSKGLI